MEEIPRCATIRLHPTISPAQNERMTNKNRRRQREPGTGANGDFPSRSICKAPRLDNDYLMEEHKKDGEKSEEMSSHQKRQSEFLNLWLDQLEETSRGMTHEKLLQRVLELESELLETQDKLKRANNALYKRKNPKNSQKSSGVSAPNSPLYSSPRYTPHASPLYTCSPIYQSPRYLVSPTAE